MTGLTIEANTPNADTVPTPKPVILLG